MKLEVPMDAIGAGPWEGGSQVRTSDLLTCSVVAVYDEHSFVFAHIPPARELNQQLQMTSADVIRDYKTRLTRRYHDTPMTGPTGYLLTSTMMDTDNRDMLRDWFRSLEFPFNELQYDPYKPDGTRIKGEFILSRKGNVWPPETKLIQ